MEMHADRHYPLSHLSDLVEDEIKVGITPLLGIFRSTCRHTSTIDFDDRESELDECSEYPAGLDEAERNYARALLLNKLSLPQQSYTYLQSAKLLLMDAYKQYTNYSEAKIYQVLAFHEKFFGRTVGGRFGNIELKITTA